MVMYISREGGGGTDEKGHVAVFQIVVDDVYNRDKGERKRERERKRGGRFHSVLYNEEKEERGTGKKTDGK
jgi:hypothetical protein